MTETERADAVNLAHNCLHGFPLHTDAVEKLARAVIDMDDERKRTAAQQGPLSGSADNADGDAPSAAASAVAAAPIQAHSKSQYKRLVSQGADVLPPASAAPTPETDAHVAHHGHNQGTLTWLCRKLERERDESRSFIHALNGLHAGDIQTYKDRAEAAEKRLREIEEAAQFPNSVASAGASTKWKLVHTAKDHNLLRLHTLHLAAENLKSAHCINELCDAVTNGIAWMKNVRDKLSQPERALTNLEIEWERCKKLVIATAPRDVAE